MRLLSLVLPFLQPPAPVRPAPPVSRPPAVAPSAAPVRPTASPTPYQLLAAEYSRGAETGVLEAALASGDSLLQRLAVRAYGRLERRDLADRVVPFLTSPVAAVRREAINALGQIGAPVPYPALLATERDPGVRAVLYETIGRNAISGGAAQPSDPPTPAVVETLVAGLSATEAPARIGAARGLEALLRRTARRTPPAPATLKALRQAFTAGGESEFRQLMLLALTAAGDRDAPTVALALRDSSAQVRRLAVALGRQWVEDRSPLVRYQALKAAGTCDRATALLRDPSQHVVLAAVDWLGEHACSADRLDSLVRLGADWRVQSHALLALATTDTIRARAALPLLATSPVWQARAWAALAAVRVHDEPTRAALATDANPNVALNALTTRADAMRALRSNHAGLVLAGATWLKSDPELAEAVPAMTDALLRLSRSGRATVRDPRAALLNRLAEVADSTAIKKLEPLRRDADPVIAAQAAQIMTAKLQRAIPAITTRYLPPPFPAETTWVALRGATARIRLRELGTLEVELFPEDAPATVATFAALAQRGAYTGLTWHRIVPNFVVQGGSPGADEYDALTPTFMRDEVGLARHARGTLGISTRGRDTGDGQLFLNLVDNMRLDHDYTVFGRVTKGLELMDRIQEGTVIDAITIRRATP